MVADTRLQQWGNIDISVDMIGGKFHVVPPYAKKYRLLVAAGRERISQ